MRRKPSSNTSSDEEINYSNVRYQRERAKRLLEQVKEMNKGKRAVRIDATTTILVNADRDPVEAKESFLRRINENRY